MALRVSSRSRDEAEEVPLPLKAVLEITILVICCNHLIEKVPAIQRIPGTIHREAHLKAAAFWNVGMFRGKGTLSAGLRVDDILRTGERRIFGTYADLIVGSQNVCCGVQRAVRVNAQQSFGFAQ